MQVDGVADGNDALQVQAGQPVDEDQPERLFANRLRPGKELGEHDPALALQETVARRKDLAEMERERHGGGRPREQDLGAAGLTHPARPCLSPGSERRKEEKRRVRTNNTGPSDSRRSRWSEPGVCGIEV